MRKKFILPGFLALLLIMAGCDQASPTGSMDADTQPTARGQTTPPSANTANSDLIPGQYIVVFDDAVSDVPGLAQQLTAGQNGQVRTTYQHALKGFAANLSAQAARALERNPNVAYVNQDRAITFAPPWCADNPNHPACGDDDGGSSQTLPWGIDRIDADLNSNTGSGIHVYVIDTGIDADHADLEANLGNGYAVEQCKGGGCQTAWDDDNDHGTHVAGTVGAIDNDIDVIGVAPKVTLHAVKVLDKNGSGSWSGVIEGIDWVASETKNHGVATVANMSLGGSGSKSGTCDDNGFTGSDAMHESICNAAHVGAVFAVAAGNDGADAENSVPAAYDDAVITVSATNESDQWESWSNWGDDPAGWTSNTSAPVAIGAPGGNILSTKRGGGTTTMSGTSMASPHVAGAAALYLASSTLTNDYSAFTSTRTQLLESDEDASGFESEDASNPHDEDFLNAESL